MKRKTKGYLSALRALLVTAACAGLPGLGIGSARATVITPLQLPGHGTATGAGVTHVTAIQNGTETISTNPGNTVISWAASGGTINTSQPGGFNIGSSAALHFGSSPLSSGPGGPPPPAMLHTVLNVDSSGNPSQIMGMLTGASNYAIFVTNANGITVGPSATIVAAAGLGLIAASVNTTQFLSNGTIPVSFASAGPLTVQGNLQGVGNFVLLAGSGAVNVSPIQSASGTYFGTDNVTVVGGVGGLVEPPVLAGPPLPPPGPVASYQYVISDGLSSVTPSATSPTTVTLNLGTLAHSGQEDQPYNMTGLTVLANGNIVNNGVLGGVPNAIPYLQWTGTLTNNGTIYAELGSGVMGGKVSFYGNTSAKLAYGGLVNNGTIATNSRSTLFVNLPGTIINNSGATISNVGGAVALFAGNASLPLFTGVGGAVINYGEIIANSAVTLMASNPNHVGPNAGGGVFSDGSIQILNVSPESGAGTGKLIVASLTGNAFLGGTVTTPNSPNGLATAFFQSGSSPVSTFTLGTNVTAQNLVTFTGGSLTGPGIVTTNSLLLTDFTGNVNNVTSPTNYLANGFHVANGMNGTTQITLNMPTTKDGAIGRQAVNLNVAGNATLTSGRTSTFVNGLGPVGIIPTEANVGSNLLVQASGNLTVNPSSVHLANYALSTGALHTPGFVFPGGIVLIAGNTLTLNTVVDNGYAPTVVAGQGIFFQAPHIATDSPVITNGNAWVNFSTAPSTVPAIYAVTPAVSTTPLGYTIVANPSAYHIRSYAP